MFDQETWTEAPEHQIHHIKDSLSSLCYRLKKVEADISGKVSIQDIDRIDGSGRVFGNIVE